MTELELLKAEAAAVLGDELWRLERLAAEVDAVSPRTLEAAQRRERVRRQREQAKRTIMKAEAITGMPVRFTKARGAETREEKLELLRQLKARGTVNPRLEKALIGYYRKESRS